ncbi:MAG: cohesin domain-containing protein [Terriglobales bacterium]|jgi:general secretion pathway protein D
MIRLKRPAALICLMLFVVLSAPAADKDKAKSFYTKGKDAEARQNYEQAYDLYKQAYDLKPTDIAYRSAFERLRFLAGASHVHRGQLLRDAGQLDQALGEFQKAAEIDSSSFIAKQEIKHTQEMIDAAKSPVPKASAASADELQRRLQQAQGPVELAPISNIPITLKLTEDTKVIFETVGKLAGINVLFDPDYTSRRIKIELNGVTLEEALQIVALESKTFWRPVTPNTIFVAQDNPAKRKDLEQSVIKTFYMSNLSQPTELQDTVNALRQILEIQRLQALPTQNAIVVRGTPDQVALAEKLVNDLDKAKPEVIVDVAIMQINRDKSKTLGINPPTSATVALQNNVSNTTTGTGTTTGTTTSTNSTSGTPNSINLNALGNLNATDFTVTISQATATALFSDSSTKLIQNPQIRAVDGQKATLKIGDRVPVATGSFGSGIGNTGLGVSPLVNTQFQYLDVGVNIDITPHIHADGQVTLKITMDISSVTSYTNIGGIQQPVIGQRKIEHEVRLKEGEVNLLGGMLEDQQTKSLTGIPGLGQIPILKYLFGQSNTDHSETETVFALIPHIVREHELSSLNEKAISVGTASAIELRRIAPLPMPAATETPVRSVAPTNPTSGVPVMPPTATNPTQSGTTPGLAGFGFDPPSIKQVKGATFTVNVLVNGVQNAHTVPVQVAYDPKLLQVMNVSNGGFLSQDGQAVALVHRDDDSSGTLQITATRPPGANGVSGQGTVLVLTFLAKSSGQGTLTISKGGVRDPNMQAVPVAGTIANVSVE